LLTELHFLSGFSSECIKYGFCTTITSFILSHMTSCKVLLLIMFKSSPDKECVVNNKLLDTS
jgi:hypothetical protein